MTVARGRVLRARDIGSVETVPPLQLHTGRAARRVDRAVVEASERATEIVAAAVRRGAEILAGAERHAAAVSERARTEGRAQGFAEIATLALRLREREDRADDASLDRTVELARLLAERLLGHTLTTSPGEIASLARQALAEARGARRIRIHAHPADAEILSAVTAELDPHGRVHAVVPDPALSRGDLRLEANVGSVDARLGTNLTRLAARLRGALRA